MTEAAGASLRYPQPYSPLSPIEHAFAKFQALLRTTFERSIDGL
jgi:hypothetical protein